MYSIYSIGKRSKTRVGIYMSDSGVASGLRRFGQGKTIEVHTPYSVVTFNNCKFVKEVAKCDS